MFKETYHTGKIYDVENVTLVTASCSSGHIHYNLTVARALAYPNSTLPNIRCGVDSCTERLLVVSAQNAILSPPVGNPT